MSDRLRIKLMKIEMRLRKHCKNRRGSWILTVVGGVLAIAAGAVTAYGQYQQGRAQNKYYKALADQNEAEAAAAEETAELQSIIGQNEAAQRSKELAGTMAEVKGTQKASMAAMGLYGVTAEDIANDTNNRAKLDEGNIRYNADMNTYGAKRDAKYRGWSLRNQANLYRYSGKQAITASNINMTSTLLGTASSLFMMGGAAKGTASGSMVQGGKGGTTTQTTQFGTTWSPSKI